METPALVDVDKRIDCMYIDTSHCSSGRPTWYIPHRTAVVRHVLDLVAQVPASDGVFIKCKQMVGFERLFKAMAERFQTKVHVNECWLRIFAGDPALAHVFTNDPSKARIHAHHDILDGQKPDYYNSHGLPLPCCKQFLNTPRRHLFLSINGCRYPGTRMWDPDIQKLDYRPPIDVQRPCGKGWHLVPYQQHSSVSEIEAFIRRVNPRVLYPCVVDPDAKITIHDVWGSLRRIRKTAEEDYFRYVAANFNHQKAVVHRPIGSRMDCGSDPSPHTNRTIPHTYEHSSNAGGLQKSSDSSESASMPSSANGSKYTAGFVSRRKAAIGKRLLRTTSCGGAVQRGRQLRSTTGHNNRVALTSCASDYSATLFVRSKSGSGDKDAKISNSVLNVNDSQSRTQTVECGTSGVNESATLEGVYYAMDTTEVRGATVCIDLT
ncbi:hypothetical protein SARC_02123 [Sphaeroforma arctica JP610]|uniref:DNA repair metallo-beta-lactamase domain-containing protein n=1 Tax=Sphaeroforma arctica JP610 TaxID=667725 RepID=A0A0L0GBT6_9EUKA|nr:hypothetical protein SARC_02123 [Sphaeroforma arctica JP610]KNC85713.1 hypothetical protein SARC_02123 [Sphaeroforma arctica JP610]|eukprot:XP_014159615.1 hypothetical protein SARC_02123 [Sphaeroforma arctica JP610]